MILDPRPMPAQGVVMERPGRTHPGRASLLPRHQFAAFVVLAGITRRRPELGVPGQLPMHRTQHPPRPGDRVSHHPRPFVYGQFRGITHR